MPSIPAETPLNSHCDHSRIRSAAWLLGLWLAIFFAASFTPPLLDDADSTHAQAAQAMLRTGDLVTLHVDGVRYLEKPPLPYWITAASMKLFGFNAFAVHFPLALTVLALALLAWRWGSRAFDEQTGFYAGIFTLTSAGVFLFTRVFIPDALLSLLLALALYAMLRALDPTNPKPGRSACIFWIALAGAVLAKGLVAPVFIFGAAAIFFALNPTARDWKRLRPLTGFTLFLVLAAPWHILAGIRNTGGADGHGFFWFYFINEHVLRFLGRRVPRDYNKLPWYLYWTLHLVWLFPWSLLTPAAAIAGWRRRKQLNLHSRTFTQRSICLLLIFSALVLVFFAISTNQEYYTLPVYLPLLVLLAAALTQAQRDGFSQTESRAITFGFASLTAIGAALAAALAFGLWTARRLPSSSDIGDLLAHRDVAGYTLSMSHFFDLTGRSFAALRLPTALALAAFAIGPSVALILWKRTGLDAAILATALTSAIFLIAAHIALVRFAPMLSSERFARTIEQLEATQAIAPNTEIAIFGDQSFGSSIIFYLDRRVLLIDGRTTSMYFGSTFADAPPIFWTSRQLQQQWGTGPRKLLFVPEGQTIVVDKLLGPRTFLIEELSGKELLTDRPLAANLPTPKGA